MMFVDSKNIHGSSIYTKKISMKLGSAEKRVSGQFEVKGRTNRGQTEAPHTD